ncbi:MAG: hypothetical protein AVO33_05615 [delta proteobacterium ML8_F1]|nr:MAG: hypothetical protein AVO33_05615 [delta proteobacterium ML8_F1]
MKLKPMPLVVGIILLLSSFLVFGETDTEDPLITLSYLEMRLKELVSTGGDAPADSGTFEVLEVAEGMSLTLGGGTEAILRAGEARAFVSPKGGIADVTAGRDIGMNEMIPANHHLVNPVADGRGFVFMSRSFVMIRGTYTLQENSQ